jgi:hypothetical protein
LVDLRALTNAGKIDNSFGAAQFAAPSSFAADAALTRTQ